LERWFASESDWRLVALRVREFTYENPLNIDLLAHGDAAGSQMFYRVRALNFDGHGIFTNNRTSFMTLIRFAGPEHLTSQVHSVPGFVHVVEVCERKTKLKPLEYSYIFNLCMRLTRTFQHIQNALPQFLNVYRPFQADIGGGINVWLRARLKYQVQDHHFGSVMQATVGGSSPHRDYIGSANMDYSDLVSCFHRKPSFSV